MVKLRLCFNFALVLLHYNYGCVCLHSKNYCAQETGTVHVHVQCRSIGLHGMLTSVHHLSCLYGFFESMDKPIGFTICGGAVRRGSRVFDSVHFDKLEEFRIPCSCSGMPYVANM